MLGCERSNHDWELFCDSVYIIKWIFYYVQKDLALKGLFFWQENKKVLKSPTDETETTVSKDLKILFGTQTGKAQVHQQELYLPINC